MINQFYAVRHVSGKYRGIQIRHYILSFSAEYDKVTAYQAYRIGDEIAKIFRADHQVLFAVHEEKDNLHIHFLVNTIDLHTGRALNNGKTFLRNLLQQISYILALPSTWSGKTPVRLMAPYCG